MLCSPTISKPKRPASQVSSYIKLVCKTFWSATYMGVPAALLQREAFLGWMGALHAALVQPQPPDVAALDAEERPQVCGRGCVACSLHAPWGDAWAGGRAGSCYGQL